MRTRLVLTNEAARHPFRQRLPRLDVEPNERKPLSDRGLFLLTFTAAFFAFSTFIA